MTDQELIVSAAKASGFLYDPSLTGEDGTLMGRYRSDPDGPVYVWNPLKDITDAVDITFRITIQIDPKEDRVWAHYGNTLHISEEYISNNSETFCRLVTRIAAEVGKNYL